MKVVWVLLGLCLMLELAAANPYPFLEVYEPRTSRMSNENNYAGDEDDDEEDDDEDGDDEQDDEAIYPPDFSKLFPNPDGRPTGPESHSTHPSHHPTQPQHGRPSFGPAKLQGPAALRGPSQAQSGMKLGGIGYRAGPASRRYSSPPPRPQYRFELPAEEVEPEPRSDVIPVHPSYVQPVHPSYVQPVHPSYVHRRVHVPQVSYPYSFGPYAGHVWAGPTSRANAGRVYNPWYRNPAYPDAYNPQFVFNPSEMRARRRFRYHASQIMPSQRIPVYSGSWGNPRNHYVHSQTGAHYSTPSWSPFF